MQFFLFKTAKPKQFEYKPRYYDPEKEELEQRRKAMGLSENQTHEGQLRAKMRYEWERRQELRKVRRAKGARLLLYVALVGLLLFFILR